MIEFGFLRKEQQDICMNTVYSYFAPYWGRYGAKGFTKVPDHIKNVRLILVRKNKFLGGLYDLQLSAAWQVDLDEKWIIKLQSRRSGCYFYTKSYSPVAREIIRQLNLHEKLLETLNQIDLSDINISMRDRSLQFNLTPMGGGMCFLVIPPVRYQVPMPKNQIGKLAESIEQIGKLITNMSCTMPGFLARQEHLSISD
ncbi:MAG: DUF3156 family protein [Flavobacteriaceae bacterium]|jgi:hypothetical protein|nr:DUF3156 family protein [Flavobacteriaceae bacterium]